MQVSAPSVLRNGDRGEAVRDLQQRLAAFGLDTGLDEPGGFGAGTTAALRAFQEQRGLRADGICGRETWAALVESGFTLGDRLLYLRSPNLRGDDIADLQRRLNALGFDASREDGILGGETSDALRDFQRNSGLAVDGILGPATLSALDRVSALAEGSIAAAREREVLRREPRELAGRRVYLAVAPGFEALGDVVERALVVAGVHVALDTSGGEDEGIASAANRYSADLCLAIRPGDRPGAHCDYFATATFRSEAGFRAAKYIQEEIGSTTLGLPREDPCGRTYNVLRETRMAAVVCEPVASADAVGMAALVSEIAGVGHAIARGVRRAFEEPVVEG